MPPEPVCHLVTVWNPHYAPAAMDDHLGVLLEWARRRGEGLAEDDQVYVWWAKLASANRQQPMRHKYTGRLHSRSTRTWVRT